MGHSGGIWVTQGDNESLSGGYMGRSGAYMCHSVSIWATQKVYGPLRKYMDHSGGKRGQAQGIWAIYGGILATLGVYGPLRGGIWATQGI